MTAKASSEKVSIGNPVADQLHELGVRGMLLQMAKRGQVIELRCEMPKCYCPTGRTCFEERSTHPSCVPFLFLEGGGSRQPKRSRILQTASDLRFLWWAVRDLNSRPLRCKSQ